MKRSKINGHYPQHSGVGKTSINLDAHLSIILNIIKIPGNDPKINKILREAINAVFGYLEAMEGYHFGESEEFVKYKPEKARIEHMTPIVIMKKQMIEKDLSSNNEILNFLKNNYGMCIITLREDMVLNSLKLNRKLPADGKDRYDVAGITLAVNPGK